MLARFLGPIKYRDDGLPLAFMQDEDAGHGVFGSVGHQVHRERRAAESGHVDEIAIFYQSHAIGVGK